MQEFMITTNGLKTLALLDTTDLHEVCCKKAIFYNQVCSVSCAIFVIYSEISI